ncbi:DEAD/DEAH box helicase [Emticicia soli]|uniref:AAA domain-containing protein n=1 Tax=Emticicia soli TaxID=2027878 RepID=A0ABW5JBV0_9BACT
MVEPAYSILSDHCKLKNIARDIDTDSLLSKISTSLKNPLNNSQKHVFNYSFKNRITLLWGPPGTGKTMTLASIVLGWIEYANENKIGINIGLGSSNWNAIDNLLLEIYDLICNRNQNIIGYSKDIIMSRIRSKSGEDFVHDKITDVIVYSQEASILKSKIEENKLITINGSTWKQLYNFSKDNKNSPANHKKWFDVILLDESSQIKVEHALAYFTYLKEDFNLVLAGDDKQLGPIHGFQMQDKQSGLFDCIYTFMKQTHKIEPQTIIDNYRSNIYINDWPNKRFYLGKLESKNPNKVLNINLPSVKPDEWPHALLWDDIFLKILDPNLPIIVITYPSSIYTVSNIFEAQIIASLCYLYKLSLSEEISSADFATKKIGIVTPHRAQRSLIHNLLSDQNITTENDSFVDTVDRFQGQERDLIMSSYTVSDKDFVTSEDEFILDPRRFNVSLTRAKSKFIMIISDALINYLPNDKKVAEDASHLQMFVLKFCKNEEKKTINILNSNRLESVDIIVRYP